MAECQDDDDTSSDVDHHKNVIHNLSNKDTIENTVFSKSWVLGLLVRLVQLIENNDDSTINSSRTSSIGGLEMCNQNNSQQDCNHNVSGVCVMSIDSSEPCVSTVECSSKDHVIAVGAGFLEEGLENELCKLWDASTNANMSLFLHEYEVIELLMGSIVRSKSSRLTEICVGIIGNMVCNQQISLEAIGTTSSQNFFLSLLSHNDSSVLIECIRLISTCLSHVSQQPTWLITLQSSTSILDDIIFVLKNSTNEELLRTLSIMLDKLLYSEETLCLKWSCQQFVVALCEASEQCQRLSAIDISCTLVLILQSLTTTKEGVETIVASECVGSHLISFLQSVSVYYYEGWDSDNRRGLMASLSLCKCLVINETQSKFKNAIKGCDVIDFIHKLSISTTSVDDLIHDDGWNDKENDGSALKSEWQTADSDNIDTSITDGTKSLANDIIMII